MSLTNGVDIAPVGFNLWVLQRITVHLTGTRYQKPCTHSFCQSKHVHCTHHIGLVTPWNTKSRTPKRTHVSNNKLKIRFKMIVFFIILSFWDSNPMDWIIPHGKFILYIRFTEPHWLIKKKNVEPRI